MVAGRKQLVVRVGEEKGPVRRGEKGKNFCKDEEQLCRSVLHVSQDRVVGNQQRAGVFWEWICEHYGENQPRGVRPHRSLETKWGAIKHDVSKFIGVYSQVLRLNRSGVNEADTLRKAHELYKQKSEKLVDFPFEHCWLLLKDHPKWAVGWSQPKVPTPKRKESCSGLGLDQSIDFDEMDLSGAGSLEGVGGGSGGGARSAAEVRSFIGRPGGTKRAKDDQHFEKVREAVMYAQAEATKGLATAHLRKVAILEDQNLLTLMSMSGADDNAKEYLRMRRSLELKKLKRRFLDEKMETGDEQLPQVPIAQRTAAASTEQASVWASGSQGSPNTVGEWTIGAEFVQPGGHHIEEGYGIEEGFQGVEDDVHCGGDEEVLVQRSDGGNWLDLQHVDPHQPTMCINRPVNNRLHPIDIHGCNDVDDDTMQFGLRL